MSFHPVNRSLWLNVNNEWKKSSLCMFYSPIPSHYFSKKAPVRSPVTNENSMSKRFFKWLFPPPPARRIIMRRHGSVKQKGAAWVWIRSGDSPRVSLESTSLITTAIATEDVKRKVKILKTLSGHDNLLISMKHMIRIIMMSILRWKILDRILSSFKRRKYTEEDANTVIIQILNVVAFCYLLGVVHR
ncbi:hypothetical protein YC2023_115653 [Brassica napus]